MSAASQTDIGFALVGCGRIAVRYGEMLSNGQVPGARLAAVCDCLPEQARMFGNKYRAPAYTDMHQMMKEMASEIAVVVILTESGHHPQHCLELAPYRKHIVVEKPMALTLADADRMIRACDMNGIKLFVVKQNRYNRPVQKLREAIVGSRFGKLVMGSVRVRWMRTQSYYDQAAWRGTWALDGGVFSNQASHHIDLLLWLMGDPVSVFAKSRRALVDIEADDTGVAVVTFANGALGVIEATTAARPADIEGSISILGENGTVEVGGFAVNEMKMWRFKGAPAGEEAEVMSCFRDNPPNVYGYGHAAYLAHVVDSIRHGAAALVDGIEGRRSLELISAIYESVETGGEVSLRFQPKKCKLGIGS